jgi:hypothetical protein
MDDQSVVEYFERFAAHAFGDTSSVMTTCVLVGPDQRTHPCSFCFTIKRDVFDIPMMSLSQNTWTNSSCWELFAHIVMKGLYMLKCKIRTNILSVL